jgi:hypothetical protein
VDKGSDEQPNKALAMSGNESTGKRMDVPLAIGFIAPSRSLNYIIFYRD